MTCSRCNQPTAHHILIDDTDDDTPQPYCALCMFLEIDEAEGFGDVATVSFAPQSVAVA